MARYFKLVCLHEDPKWYLKEFLEGRARFGWSGPGSDLRSIKAKMDAGKWRDRTDNEAQAWSYTRFLIERIAVGHRVVVQTEQPLRNFLIGEVIAPRYDFTPGDLDDFNHVLHIIPLTREAIPINLKAVTGALKHDLSKRGHYYEIYPEDSVHELDTVVEQLASKTLDLTSTRTDDDTLDDTLRRAKDHIIREISVRWRGKDFERFCERICKSLDYVEVKERSDRGKGWDLLIRIINPITETILLDDVPVQCKNYTGDVWDNRAINDLERCIRNSKSPVAYLFIIGKLMDDFLPELERRKKLLEQELGFPISFELVDQDRIAELYMNFVALYPASRASTTRG
jgi:hypothetical protein